MKSAAEEAPRLSHTATLSVCAADASATAPPEASGAPELQAVPDPAAHAGASAGLLEAVKQSPAAAAAVALTVAGKTSAEPEAGEKVTPEVAV